MIKLLFILFNSLILLWPNFVRSDTAIELVEVYLINQLDDQRGYCVDIKGHKSRAKINRGIQAQLVIHIKERSLWIKVLTEKE
tara:strand:- start:904 stop:1152 length:249 start_codon:yes stop_codon:yes gene_type:complete